MLSLIACTSTEKEGFSAENKFISLVDNRNWIAYSASLCLSIYKECMSRLQRAETSLKNAPNLFPRLQDNGLYPENLQPWLSERSSRLIVLIHGLNSSPLCWSKYIQRLSTCDKSINYFAPCVYKKGYCTLKEASKPILHVIQKYADQYPNNPIILVGHSNGARIAQYVEERLEAKNIRLVSIAGPHLGSKLINWVTFFRLNAWLGISASMANELEYNSEWVNKKLTNWQRRDAQNLDKVVKRIFFASADDLRIFPNSTSFPNLPSSTYYLISGESHVTIVDAVYENVLVEVLK